MKCNLIITVCTGISLVLVSCKKEDGQIPSISITAPNANTTYQVFDAVQVEAHVSDNENIEWIDMRILDPNGIPAAPTWRTQPGTVTYHAQHSFHLGDIHLPGGVYTIRVEAFDGTNSNIAFRSINVTEIPRSLKRVMITRTSAGMVYLDSLTGTVFNPFFSTPGDYSGAVVNSWWQHIYLQGKYTSPLTAYYADDMMPLWSIAALPNGTLPYFNRILFAPSLLVYSADGYGFLKGYNKNGLVVENISSPANRTPFNWVEIGPYIVSEHRNASNNHLLQVNYRGTGAFVQQEPVTFNWQKMETKGTTQVVLAGNNGTQGELRVYTVSTNVLFEPVNIPAGKIYDMVKVDDDTYLISHATGILKYTWSNSNLVNITTGNVAQKLAYDVTLGTVVAAEGNILKSYHPITGAPGFTYTATDSIRDILLLFNK